MTFELDVVNILIATIAIINTLYGLTVFSRNRKNTTNQSFFFLTIAVSSWGVAMLFLRGAVSPEFGVWGARALYATAALIPFASVYFARLFPEESRKLTNFELNVVPIPFIIVLVFTLLPNFGMITGIKLTDGEPIIYFNLIQHTLYVLYIVGYFSWVYVILFKKLFAAQKILRIQLVYILIGTLTTTGIAVITNLLLPYFGIFSLNWFGQIGILAMITFIMYSVLKHHLFNINVIATELFVVVLQLTLFTQIFIAQSLQERLISIGVFSASLIIGLLLIRSVIREVETRREVERLAKSLEKANDKLTELDKLKNQFLSIASHDLRAPLTAIRNFMSILLEGTYGKLPAAAEEGTRQVFDRATEMAEMVDDYLNVSRIEQGRMKYDFTQINFAETLNEVIESFNSIIKDKGLTLNYTDINQQLLMRADESKIKEIIENLLNNAINYTPDGSITVTATISDEKVRVSFTDTGIGMDQKTIQNLFKFLTPGEESRKYNPKSTGIGLYIASAHVKAHKGKIWAKSDGEGKGSEFIIELPLT